MGQFSATITASSMSAAGAAVYNTIYPAYLNKNKMRSEGRRVPSDLAISNPTISEIAKVLGALGAEHQEYAEKMYCRESERKPSLMGVIKYKKLGQFKTKRQLLAQICRQIAEMREAADAAGTNQQGTALNTGKLKTSLDNSMAKAAQGNNNNNKSKPNRRRRR